MTDHDKVLALCPPEQATVTTTHSGPLSDFALADGDKLYVPPGIIVTLDVQTPKLKWLRVDGSLIFDHAANTRLWCETAVTTMGSVLDLGNDADPVTGQCDLVFADFGPMDFSADLWAFGRGLIVMGELKICGKPVTARVRTLGNRAGESVVHFQKPVIGWKAGDPIVMAGVSVMANEDEERTISSVAADGMSMVLNAPLSFDHVRLADPKTGLFREMFVINRSKRTVHVTSESSDPKRFGHVMTMNGNMTDVCHASFVNLGRTDKSFPITDPDGIGGGLGNPRGRYMFHAHGNGGAWADVPTRVEECYFEGSPGWGLTNHASYMNADGCGLYKIFGSHLVGENGLEIGRFKDCSALRTTCLTPVKSLIEPFSPISDYGNNGHGIWHHAGGIEVYDCDVAGFPLSHGVFLEGFITFRLPPTFTEEVVFPHTNLKGTPNNPYYLTHDVAPALVPQVIDGLNVFACGQAFEPWQVGLNITAKLEDIVRASEVKNCWFEASLQAVMFGYMTHMNFTRCVIPDPIPSVGGAFAAVGHSGFTGGISWDNLSMLAVPGRQRWPSAMPGWTSQDNRYTNCAIRSEVGISIPQVFTRTQRSITFDAATTFDCTTYKVRLKMNHFGANLYLTDPRYPMFMGFLSGGGNCHWDDVIKVGDQFLYYPELADDFDYSAIPNLPPHAVGHTNATFWTKYHSRIGAKLLPPDAVIGTDGIEAYVSLNPPTILEDIWVTESSRSHGAYQQTVNADGPLVIQDAAGNWVQAGPYTYALGLNCPQIMVSGVQLGVWVNRIPDGSPYPNRQAYDWWVSQPPAGTPLQPALPLPDMGNGPPPPAPTISIAADPSSGIAPLTVSFAAVVTNTNSVAWDFGDGATATGFTASHTYAAGDFVVTATATGPGGTATRTVAVSVTEPQPPPVDEWVEIPGLLYNGKQVAWRND